MAGLFSARQSHRASEAGANRAILLMSWLACACMLLPAACATTRAPVSQDSLVWVLQQGMADDPDGAIRVIAKLEAYGLGGSDPHRGPPIHDLVWQDATISDAFTADDSLSLRLRTTPCFPLGRALHLLDRVELRPDEHGSVVILTPFNEMVLTAQSSADQCLTRVRIIRVQSQH